MMKRFLIDWYCKTAEKLMQILPDWVTGSSETMYQKYRMKYGDRDCHPMVRQKKMHNMFIYMSLPRCFLSPCCAA